MKPTRPQSAIARALKKDKTVDITTTGRMSGQPRRIEIWFHLIHGRIYITGIPRPRDWYANLKKNPALVFHLKESTQADLPARARLIVDPVEREGILGADKMEWYHQRSESREAFIVDAPLVEVSLEESTESCGAEMPSN